jgi:hypothetical protein
MNAAPLQRIHNIVHVQATVQPATMFVLLDECREDGGDGQGPESSTREDQPGELRVQVGARSSPWLGALSAVGVSGCLVVVIVALVAVVFVALARHGVAPEVGGRDPVGVQHAGQELIATVGRQVEHRVDVAVGREVGG